MNPTLPGFDSPAKKRPWKRVRDTSRAAYADGRERFTGRKADVLRWLAYYWNCHQESPTSAELTAFEVSRETGDMREGWISHILYVRRGLSDLQTSGVVESAGKRTCRVTNKLCHTWRVVSR